jgi:hypothetical protein
MSKPILLISTAAALVAAAVVAGPAGAGARTTAPQRILTARVVLSDHGIALSVGKVPRGALVIFRIRNTSARARDFRLAQRRSGLIEPGKSARFELDFLDRTTWTYTSTGPKARTVVGRFIVF